jgi:DnaK suppressor protein
MARKDALLRLHARLVTRRDALRKALSGDVQEFYDLAASDFVGDQVDAAVDTANDEISTQLVEIESRELGQIEHALDRIVKGQYGRCEFCGEKIAEARLNALPYTNSCIDCQRENERTGGRYGASTSTPDSGRWASVFGKSSDDSDGDSPVNLSDFELDLSETGR